MEETRKMLQKAKCQVCGQLVVFKIDPAWRKTKLLRCPSCKQESYVLTDNLDNALHQLILYEESGVSPNQLGALSTIWKEGKKIPGLRKQMEKWEAKLDEMQKEVEGLNGK